MLFWKRLLLIVVVTIGVLYAPIGAVGMMASCRCLGELPAQADGTPDSGSKKSCCEREKPLSAPQIANKGACCCSLTPSVPYTKVRVAGLKVADKAASAVDAKTIQPNELVKVLHPDATAVHPVKPIWIWNCSQLC